MRNAIVVRWTDQDNLPSAKRFTLYPDTEVTYYSDGRLVIRRADGEAHHFQTWDSITYEEA